VAAGHAGRGWGRSRCTAHGACRPGSPSCTCRPHGPSSEQKVMVLLCGELRPLPSQLFDGDFGWGGEDALEDAKRHCGAVVGPGREGRQRQGRCGDRDGDVRAVGRCSADYAELSAPLAWSLGSSLIGVGVALQPPPLSLSSALKAVGLCCRFFPHPRSTTMAVIGVGSALPDGHLEPRQNRTCRSILSFPTTSA
jgi:hypothetical protein